VEVVEEGAVHRPEPAGEGRCAQPKQRAAGNPNLGAGVDGLSADGRAHGRHPQREGSRPDLHLGADGWPQARRVCPDANVPGPRQGRGPARTAL
ncbi:MAG: SSU ribosomal protein S19p (S15e), partial [uncultured Thermomicrobiales bacterium]